MLAGIREYSPGRYGISRGARERMTRVVFCPEGKDAKPLRVLAQCRQEQTARHIARLFQRERDAQAKAAAAQGDSGAATRESSERRRCYHHDEIDHASAGRQ